MPMVAAAKGWCVQAWNMGVSRQHTLGIYCGLPGPGRVSWGSCVRWAAPRAEVIQLCLQIQLLPQGPSSAGSSVRGELLAPLPVGEGLPGAGLTVGAVAAGERGASESRAVCLRSFLLSQPCSGKSASGLR